MRNVLVTMPFEDRHKAYIEKIGADCEFHYTSRAAATKEEIQNAQIIIGNVNPDLIEASENLEWIQLNSAGADEYCAPGILDKKTILTNATGAYGLAISEYMLGVAFMMQNKLYRYYRQQLDHQWKAAGKVSSIEGSVTLVIGLGDIGGEFARKMKALGSYVIGVRRKAGEKPEYLDEIYTTEHLDELLGRADFVAMSLPNTPQTYRIMDERRLRLMKKTAFLINVGRGNAVDPEALCKVLQEGHLGGCAVDVTDPEPLPADHPLWDAPRMIITPHVAGKFNLPETFERIVRISGENLEKFLAGDRDGMRNLVDFETGYRKR